jgi:hypothetical protein
VTEKERAFVTQQNTQKEISTGILRERFAECVHQTHGSENSVHPRHTLLSPHQRGNTRKKHSLIPINLPGRLEEKNKALFYRPSATRNMQL